MTIDSAEKTDPRAMVMGALKKALLCGAGAVCGGWFLAEISNHFFPLPALLVNGLRITGLSLDAAGGYGLLGWTIQTWGGESEVEKLNRKCLSVLWTSGVLVSCFAFNLTSVEHGATKLIQRMEHRIEGTDAATLNPPESRARDGEHGRKGKNGQNGGDGGNGGNSESGKGGDGGNGGDAD